MSYFKFENNENKASALALLRRAYEKGEIPRLPDADCGGRGKCGKCRVVISGPVSHLSEEEKKYLTDEDISKGVRLACMVIPGPGAEVFLPDEKKEDIVSVKNGSGYRGGVLGADEECGVAVDIGTTSAAVYAVSGRTGEICSASAVENPQRIYGADVLSRIQNIRNDPALLGKMSDMLFEKIIACLEKEGIGKDRITCAVITGNTIMEHIAAKLDPCGMAELPFRPESLFGDFRRSPLFENTYYSPCFSAYVGGDIATGFCETVGEDEPGTVLYLDIGTNGETALLHEGKLTVCSTAAGPAFEGAQTECGCVGIPGAVDSAKYNPENGISFTTINGEKPTGICGSGLISLGAALLDAGMLDEAGNLDGGRYELTKDVYLTQNDVRQLQLAKAAVCAGILTLLESAGIDPDDVDKVYLAGSFGAKTDCRHACRIGLMPPEFEDKTAVVGNAAGVGAARMLFDAGFRQRVEKTVADAEYLDLSSCRGFNSNFIMCMGFE